MFGTIKILPAMAAAVAGLVALAGQPAETLRPDDLDAPAATSVLDAQRAADMAQGMAGGEHGGHGGHGGHGEHGGPGSGTYRHVDAGREPDPAAHPARPGRERLLEARARADYLRTVVVPRRQRILSLTQLEYNAMQRGVFDLIRARQGLSDALREHVLAVRDYWLARTELDAAVSGVLGFSVRPERPQLNRMDLFESSPQQESKEHE